LRARLAANRHTHPLFDMAAMAEDFADCVERASAGPAAALSFEA